MYKDVLTLSYAEGAIGGLIFNGAIPPAIKVEDVVGFGQVQANATRPQREDKHRGLGRGILKLGNHPVAPGYVGATMQVVGIVMLNLFEMALQRATNLRELRENERALAAIHHLFDHLSQPLELVGAVGGEGAAILQELHGM